jgi:uncharacterized protein (DUF58 family)
MADKLRYRPRFRLTPAGAAVLFLPLVLLYKGISQIGTAALIVGIGMPSLVILSLLFLLAAAVSIYRTARNAESCTSVLPGNCEIGRRVQLEINPERSHFLPGVKLSVHWVLLFGPFKLRTAAALPAAGPGHAVLIFSRRGEWTGRSFIRARDPFGFFYLDFPCGVSQTVSVPPSFAAIEGIDIPGRPDAEAATAPKLKEDAEERLERRTYVRGDDPRRLDWKLYARTGDMLVRVGEEGVPYRGRQWIRVISPETSRFGKKSGIRRLDICLAAAAALVRRLEGGGQDLRVLLPGETQWAGTETRWDQRLAGSLPSPEDPKRVPKPGERYWIIAHPGDSAGRKIALEARNHGCRVSLGYPAGRLSKRSLASWFLHDDSPEKNSSGPVLFRRYRRTLELEESRAETEGLDVRRI